MNESEITTVINVTVLSSVNTMLQHPVALCRRGFIEHFSVSGLTVHLVQPWLP